MLEHPAHAALSCRDCQAWIYDIKTAKPALRKGAKQRRKPGQPTPCGECPKGSPQNSIKRKNLKTWELYWIARSGGLSEHERTDSILRSNLALVHQLVEYSQLAATMRAKL